MCQLYNDKNKGVHFKDCISMYNSLFTFTSTEGRVDYSVNCGGDPLYLPFKWPESISF